MLDETASRYFKPDPEELYDLYYESMERVTIFTKVEVHNTTNEKLVEMEKSFEKRMDEKDKENERLREDIEVLKALEKRRQERERKEK